MSAEITEIKFKDARYPKLLKEIPNPPKQLYTLGELPDDRTPKIAVVGTRKATTEGRWLAKKIAQELAQAGVVIVSGLAMGIDAAAHEGAVGVGTKTIGVLGNGLDKIYPAQNENLARRILELGGAIISEYPPGTPAYPANFLERNRIVSGLCLGVVIVEAPRESGALVTTRFALEQNREVFVAPGPARHFNYGGSHQLIRDGACLVTSAKEILEELNLVPIVNLPELSENEELIFEIIGDSSRALKIDKIAEQSKLEIQFVNQIVATLAIKGLIEETDELSYRRKSH